MKKYPARWIGIVMAAVGLAAAFGLFALTPEKTVAIEVFLLAVLPIIQALATERKVYSPETHMQELEVDYEAGRKAGKKEAG